MLPLFPFIAGVIAGTAAVSLYRNQKTRGGLKDAKDRLKKKSAQAQETLRHAAVSGLSTIESSSARWRDRLQAAPEAPVAEKKTAPAKKAAPRARKQAAPKAAATTKKAGS